MEYWIGFPIIAVGAALIIAGGARMTVRRDRAAMALIIIGIVLALAGVTVISVSLR